MRRRPGKLRTWLRYRVMIAFLCCGMLCLWASGHRTIYDGFWAESTSKSRSWLSVWLSQDSLCLHWHSSVDHSATNSTPQTWGPIQIGDVFRLEGNRNFDGPGTHDLLLHANLIWPTAVLGALSLILWWQTRRRPPSSCERCAYDLDGLPPGSPCPECGAQEDLATAKLGQSVRSSSANSFAAPATAACQLGSPSLNA